MNSFFDLTDKTRRKMVDYLCNINSKYEVFSLQDLVKYPHNKDSFLENCVKVLDKKLVDKFVINLSPSSLYSTGYFSKIIVDSRSFYIDFFSFEFEKLIQEQNDKEIKSMFKDFNNCSKKLENRLTKKHESNNFSVIKLILDLNLTDSNKIYLFDFLKPNMLEGSKIKNDLSILNEMHEIFVRNNAKEKLMSFFTSKFSVLNNTLEESEDFYAFLKNNLSCEELEKFKSRFVFLKDFKEKDEKEVFKIKKDIKVSEFIEKIVEFNVNDLINSYRMLFLVDNKGIIKRKKNDNIHIDQFNNLFVSFSKKIDSLSVVKNYLTLKMGDEQDIDLYKEFVSFSDKKIKIKFSYKKENVDKFNKEELFFLVFESLLDYFKKNNFYQVKQQEKFIEENLEGFVEKILISNFELNHFKQEEKNKNNLRF